MNTQMTPSKIWAYMVTIMAFIIVILSFIFEGKNLAITGGIFSTVTLFAGTVIVNKQHQDTKKQINGGSSENVGQ